MYSKYRLYDIDLCVGMILRDLDASGIYSYIKIIENKDGQFYYDHSEDCKIFHHGFRRNVSDLCSIAFFEIVSDPRKMNMYLCFHATNQGRLVVEKNIHCQSIPFELDKYHFLQDGLTVEQRRFLEKVTCENFETRYIEFNSFVFCPFTFEEI